MIGVRNDRTRITALVVLATALLLAASAVIAALSPRSSAPAPDRVPERAALRSAPATEAVTAPVIARADTPLKAPPPRTAAPEPTLVVKRVLPIAGVAFGDWHWDDRGVPPGRVVMTVDLKAQTISVFRGGYEIGTAAVLYGANDKPTPLGRFPILEKDRDHVSNLYDAPMPYMLRLTMDGVAIHGSDVKWGMATHGCIGVPTPFAKKLFDVAQKGDVVIVTEGKLLKLGDRIA